MTGCKKHCALFWKVLSSKKKCRQRKFIWRNYWLMNRSTCFTNRDLLPDSTVCVIPTTSFSPFSSLLFSFLFLLHPVHYFHSLIFSISHVSTSVSFAPSSPTAELSSKMSYLPKNVMFTTAAIPNQTRMYALVIFCYSYKRPMKSFSFSISFRLCMN